MVRRVVHGSDGHVIEGQQITRVCFENALVLMTHGGGAHIRVECPFYVSGVEGHARIEVDPARPWDHLEVLVRFLYQEIATTEIEESGELRVSFSGGQVLVCPPYDGFEAWTITLAAGDLFVCLPGGGLTHFPPRARP
jgi:hypothetical protein